MNEGTIIKPIFYLLDDDHATLDLVEMHLEGMNGEVRKYTDAEAMLADFDGTKDGCLFVDLKMPGVTGMEVLQRMQAWAPIFPIIILSAYANVSMTVSIMRAGAFHLIEKPVIRDELLASLEAALSWAKDLRKKQKESIEIWIAMQTLTPRESEVLNFLVEGLSSRDIGEKLSISRFTVDHHRARILAKLSVSTLSKLTSCVARAKAVIGSDAPKLVKSS